MILSTTANVTSGDNLTKYLFNATADITRWTKGGKCAELHVLNRT